MPRKPTPTFVHEMPLRTDRQMEHALNKRFAAAHFPYNVTLQEMLTSSPPTPARHPSSHEDG